MALKGSGRLPTAGRLIVPVLGLVLSVLAGWLAVQGVDIVRVGQLLGQFGSGFVVLAVCVVVVELWVRSLRWSLLLPRPVSGRPPIGRLLPVLLIGYLGNTVLPARIGDAARAVLVGRRENVPTAAALGSVVLERIIDTLLLALLVFPAAIVARAPSNLVGAAGVAAVLAAAVLLFAQTRIPVSVVRIAHRRARWSPATALLDHAVRFLEAMKAKGRVLTIASAMGLTLGIWALEATVYWLTGRSLDIGLSPAAALLVAAVAVLGTAVPSAPGYVGTFELAVVSVARVLGVEQSAALVFAILVHAATTLPLAVGGVMSLLWLGIKPRELRLRPRGEADPDPTAVTTLR